MYKKTMINVPNLLEIKPVLVKVEQFGFTIVNSSEDRLLPW